jgi:hypothetical protein
MLTREYRCRSGVWDVSGWIWNARFLKAAATQDAAVASAAGPAVGIRVIATVGDRVIDPERSAETDDLCLAERAERGMNREPAALYSGFGTQIQGGLKGAKELGTAIGIPGVIDGVDSDEEIVSSANFCVCRGEGKKDQVAGGDIGDGNLTGGSGKLAISLGDSDVSCECRAADGAKVELEGAVLGRAELGGQPSGGDKLVPVSLAVVKREREAAVSLGACDSEDGGAIKPTGEQDDGGRERG